MLPKSKYTRQNVRMIISLIAPCGMNCALCYAYLRAKDNCKGCNFSDVNKPTSCRKCIIKNCEHFSGGKSKYCFDCKKYPCQRLKQLDKRYKTKYGMSMIENLNIIKERGIRQFIKLEKQRRACPKCGNFICIHRNECSMCGTERKIQQYK